ncbi:MAG: exodeoxyribonuclease VII small subunit [Lachnospiraceae bacterium]|nr:exodeoxyribonuclease VII small subunit [Lachnospiraceae bacterium]
MGLTSENSEMTIEESFAVLDDMASRLEDDELALEESFSLYQKGMAMLKDLNDRIDRVEKQMQIISGDGATEDFT